MNRNNLRLCEMSPAMLFSLLEHLPTLDELNEHLNCRLCYKPQIRSMIKRVTDITRELDSKIAEEEFKCSVDRFYVHPTDPARREYQRLRQINEVHGSEVVRTTKHDCKVPITSGNGFKKVGFDKPVANPKNRIRIDRSKIRIGKG